MSEKTPKIKKIIINGREYVDIKSLLSEIALLGLYKLNNGDLLGAASIGALVGAISQESIYEVYPKKGEKGDNLVQLFDSITNKE